ncbi:MAG: HAD family hydrolase [Candidatus Woesearchaeota archaeon]|nr:HAD family hydrolase [Candidatus Woesearchaeota archaeon]
MNYRYVPSKPAEIRYLIWDIGGPIYQRNSQLDAAVLTEFYHAIHIIRGYSMEKAAQLYGAEYERTHRARESLIALTGKDCLNDCMDAVDVSAYLSRDAELECFLQGLRQNGIASIALTNGPMKFSQNVIKAVIGSDSFLYLIAAEELMNRVGVVKPSSEIFRYVMTKTGEPTPLAYLSIGDEPSKDLDPAIEVGMQAFILDRGDAILFEKLKGFF